MTASCGMWLAGSGLTAALAHHFGGKAAMRTAVAVQGFELFAEYLSAATDRIDSPLEALHAHGRAYLECSDLYPGHFEIMFRPLGAGQFDLERGLGPNVVFMDLNDVPATTSTSATPTILIIGASRGLGHAMAGEFLKNGWNVVGTVRAGAGRTLLHDLADAFPGRLEIELLDINEPAQIASLRERLAGRSFEMLFVNAGTTSNEEVPIGLVPTEDFVNVMVTNALSPMRVIEALQDLVSPAGLIGAMSSGQGSITNNSTGLREVYRGSKAALNMFMRSFAARQSHTARAFVLMAPGWVQTGLGGAKAPFTIEESVPKVVNVLLEKRERPGLEYLDRFGQAVPW